MLDTMTLTKIAGGVLGALLFLLLGKWAAEELYHGASHGEASYVIEIEGGETAETVEEVDVAALVAAADISKGEKVFRKCSACHKVDGTDGVGPHLDGVVGRDIASIGGFGYSGALTALDGVWSAEALYGFLENPKTYAPGTTMGFSGLKKPQDKAAVIGYLQSLGG